MKPFNHTLHKELWNALAEKPGYPKEFFINKMPKDKRNKFGIYKCTACQYVIINLGEIGHNCTECPFNIKRDINWNPGNCLGGLYEKWCCGSIEEMEETAKQIRNMPVRPDVECI